MTVPNQLSMEALLAEGGACVAAGLPEGLRAELERLRERDRRLEAAREKRARLERLLATIAEQQARLETLHRELEAALRDYSEAALGVAVA